ncbi:dTDP-4-dehydrorhamnose 3,5-epimerase [Flagellimonas olearia]|uniref:dTDP-4-dehydrorhamnose 3,5-epimerase n=1 Tax=Flagellimonas olearia TaxID=552546 RepID=A0A444VNK7_9FLAO|nr:dTDP-4-dehydrorhamnose 3,5-epimerase [Allomuricauda olearia]RYC52378.1 dTDP-4-dehydrorhamnose 3,5-epimerase [Allomuricauda olearia]
MKVTETQLQGCFVLEPKIFEDDRGFFYESYSHKSFSEAIGREVIFVQDNFSFSKKGVLRGLHYQKGEYAQAKLVSVLEGKVQDVVVDIRKDSPTYGQHISIELSSENKRQLFVPRGFAHGFLVLSETARFFYKCDNYYNKESEEGIRYDDETLGIDWGISMDHLILSERDRSLPPIKT